jgi:hypothetical protein
MKKIRDKSVGVTIHLYMEISQGNFLCSYLYQNKQKCHVFLFIFSPSSTKLKNQRAKQMLPSGRAGTSGRREIMGKGEKGVNIVQKMCTRI